VQTRNTLYCKGDRYSLILPQHWRQKSNVPWGTYCKVGHYFMELVWQDTKLRRRIKLEQQLWHIIECSRAWNVQRIHGNVCHEIGQYSAIPDSRPATRHWTRPATRHWTSKHHQFWASHRTSTKHQQQTTRLNKWINAIACEAGSPAIQQNWNDGTYILETSRLANTAK